MLRLEAKAKLAIGIVASVGLLVAFVQASHHSATCQSDQCQEVDAADQSGMLYPIPASTGPTSQQGEDSIYAASAAKNDSGQETASEAQRDSEFASTSNPAGNESPEWPIQLLEEPVSDRQLITLAAPVDREMTAQSHRAESHAVYEAPAADHSGQRAVLARHEQNVSPVRLVRMDQLVAPYRSITPAIPPMRAKPKTCIVRDLTTSEKTMTIKLMGELTSTAIDSLPTGMECEGSSPKATRYSENEGHFAPACGAKWSMPSHQVRKKQIADPVATRLSIDFDKTSGKIKIDATNIEIKSLLSTLANRTQKPIHTSPTVEGTLSATVTADHQDVALRRMIQPFGYVVHDHHHFLYVCGRDEPSKPRFPSANGASGLAGRTNPGTVSMTSSNARQGTADSFGYPATGKVAVQPIRPVSANIPVSPNRVRHVQLGNHEQKERAVSSAPLSASSAMAMTPGTKELTQPKTPAVSETVVASEISQAPVSRKTTTAMAKPAVGSKKSMQPSRPVVSKQSSVKPTPKSARSNKAKALLPGDVRIAMLAQDAFANGKKAYAREVLTQGVIRYPSSALLLRLLGEGYFYDRDFEAARQALSNAIKIDKQDHYANELLGQTLAKLGQPQRASHYLMQARSLKEASR